jgi:hypothetical protein
MKRNKYKWKKEDIIQMDLHKWIYTRGFNGFLNGLNGLEKGEKEGSFPIPQNPVPF